MGDHRGLADGQLLHGLVNNVRDADKVSIVNGNSTGRKKRVPKVVQKVCRILNANAETNKILRQATSCPIARTAFDFVFVVA